MQEQNHLGMYGCKTVYILPACESWYPNFFRLTLCTSEGVIEEEILLSKICF